ncbi:type IV pilus modification protein PilV [Aquitalea sp. FJL05]|uniref:type IV pilus modification protein PilV n=1 Tax=Aquitalea TaxID=407217 RepID=UPI000F5B6441|nr:MULTISPECIES: type IV pilus modification protein PilV [Aquitalea]RQO72760.1 type IV pilus modification protein PilV [Aquitalea sp. FJL05]
MHRKTESGFTILEALISLLVVAFGMLAMAGMQLKSIRDTHDAYVRSLASEIATEAAERIRASVGDQLYTVNSTTGKVDLSTTVACYLGSTASSTCSSVISSVQSIVASDITYMVSTASQSLSSGTLAISLLKPNGTTTTAVTDCSYTLSATAASAGTACSVQVQVGWMEKTASGGAITAASFTYAFR